MGKMIRCIEEKSIINSTYEFLMDFFRKQDMAIQSVGYKYYPFLKNNECNRNFESPSYRSFLVSGLEGDTILLFPIVENRILREFPTKLSICLLFTADYSVDFKTHGYTQEEIKKYAQEKEKYVLEFYFNEEETDADGSNARLTDRIHFCPINEYYVIRNDIGPEFISFPDVKQLKEMEIPSEFCSKSYSIDMEQSCSPFAAPRGRFVLYAKKTKNPNKEEVKVLTWHPRQEYCINAINQEDSSIEYNAKTVFFEMGILKKEESHELYQFMIQNDNQILFARSHYDKIIILGGVDIFYDNDLLYPSCLLNIPIV